MRVLVCEFVTGGGLRREALSPSLAAEGALMRDTLVGDLEDLPGIRVLTTHDDRLPPPLRGDSRPVAAGDDAGAIWAELAAGADLAWPIAPETDGAMEAVVARLRQRCRRVVASDEEALRIGASKQATAARFAAAGVPVVPCWQPGAIPPHAAGPLVVKPDDGAGSLGIRLCPSREDAAAAGPGMVVQPHVAGAAESLTLLCQSGRAEVLGINRQHVTLADGRFGFHGVTVGIRPPGEVEAGLAQAILAALPGLHGLVGVDYLATPDGPVVVEVNPRLTTSYAGLRRSLGINPLAFVADLVRDGVVPKLPHLPPPVPVEVLV
ncbi:ATP-grasp domain-containing protein [Ancylobacter oerskovii]|uniref:ATP-grasp domain-containing protein n=1 Tax=Ancylobacter oerskovii TaxID=459519 RepID=A0ABW4YY52_9HYPH|nr:ATP-grasp domain-containing protein [Ancylobacter oerskovii]MBS7541974.1 ATP-grasp domain-containing protein [Ancylobacter oerskovii]